MAVTSLWRIQGWLGKVVIYIEDPKKTTNPSFVAAESLDDVIRYAVDQNKTTLERREIQLDDEGINQKQQFVSGVNCLPDTARFEMMAVKKRFGKENGTVAYHGYQSFAPGEATPEMAHEIGMKLATQLWGDRYQVLVATHLDHANHIHNHFLINTVSFVDGIKFHRTKRDYVEMRKASDTLCKEYCLSTIEKPNRPGQSYAIWKAGQEGKPTMHSLVKADVDEAILAALTDRHFFQLLRDKGYELKIGKDISVRPPGRERFVRLARNFGESYTLEAIRKRILQHPFPQRPKQQAKRPASAAKVKTKSWKSARRLTGLQSRYFYWCHKLGIQPKTKHGRKRHYIQREDYLKFNDFIAESWLLTKNRIETSEQLQAYRSQVEETIQSVSLQRKRLYRLKRTVEFRDDSGKQAELQEQIDVLTKQIRSLRREIHLCDNIAERSIALQEKIKIARQDELNKKEEERQHEHGKRSRFGSGQPGYSHRC